MSAAEHYRHINLGNFKRLLDMVRCCQNSVEELNYISGSDLSYLCGSGEVSAELGWVGGNEVFSFLAEVSVLHYI